MPRKSRRNKSRRTGTSPPAGPPAPSGPSPNPPQPQSSSSTSNPLPSPPSESLQPEFVQQLLSLLPHLEHLSCPLPFTSDAITVIGFADVRATLSKAGFEARLAMEGLGDIRYCLPLYPKPYVTMADLSKGKKLGEPEQPGSDESRLVRFLPREYARAVLALIPLGKPGVYLPDWEYALGDTVGDLVERRGAVGDAYAYLIARVINAYLAACRFARVVAHVEDSALRRTLKELVPGDHHEWFAGGASGVSFDAARWDQSIRHANRAGIAAHSRAAVPAPMPQKLHKTFASAVTASKSHPLPSSSKTSSLPASSDPISIALPPLLSKFPIARHSHPAPYFVFFDSNVFIHPNETAMALIYAALESSGFIGVILHTVVSEVKKNVPKARLEALAGMGNRVRRLQTHTVEGLAVFTSSGEQIEPQPDTRIRLEALEYCRKENAAMGVMISGDRAMIAHFGGLRDKVDPKEEQTIFRTLFRPTESAREWKSAPELHTDGGLGKWMKRNLLALYESN